jgi:hypothetical protein
MKFNKHGIAKVYKRKHGIWTGDPFLIALSQREAVELQAMFNSLPREQRVVINQEIHHRVR